MCLFGASPQKLYLHVCQMQYVHERMGQYWDWGGGRQGSADTTSRCCSYFCQSSLLLRGCIIQAAKVVLPGPTPGIPDHPSYQALHWVIYRLSVFFRDFDGYPPRLLSWRWFITHCPGWLKHAAREVAVIWIKINFHQFQPKTLPFSKPQGW